MKATQLVLRVYTLVIVAAGAGFCVTAGAADAASDGWTDMFDGKTLEGWKVSKDNPDSFKVADGAIIAHGPRAHLYYDTDEPFTDFEFEADVMTTPGSNSGIYFHTQYQEDDWPKYGYEAQVNATHGDPKKSGGVYGVQDVFQAPHEDDQWFKYGIRVEGKRVVLKINDKVTADYTEPDGKQPGQDFARVLDKGTIALQAHDPGSKVLFKNLRIKRLK